MQHAFHARLSGIQFAAERVEPLAGHVDGLVQMLSELVGEGADSVGELVDHGDGLVAQFGQGPDERGGELLAGTAERGLEVGEHAVETVACGFGRAAQMFLHRGLEVGERHLAFGYHLLRLGRGDLVMVGKVLQDGYAGFHELEHLVALQFAGGGDLAEDRAHLAEFHAGDLRGVTDRGEHTLELLSLLDTGSDQTGGDTGRITQAERRALDGGERVVHDAVDAFGVVAEGLEFGLGAFDVERTVEAAFGGQCGQAAADGCDGAEAYLAYFFECRAEVADDGAPGFAYAGGGGLVDLPFDGFAQSFGAGADDDVAGSQFLCHGSPPLFSRCRGAG